VNISAASATARPSGTVFRITRQGSEFDATFVSAVAVIPGEGVRDEAPEHECWEKAPGWCLTFR
jgi:hypothetical protein